MLDLNKYKNQMFATQPTTVDAMNYAHKVIKAMPSEVQAHAYTALQVVINSVVAEIEREAPAPKGLKLEKQPALSGTLSNGASVSIEIEDTEVEVYVGGWFLTSCEMHELSDEVADDIKTN